MAQFAGGGAANNMINASSRNPAPVKEYRRPSLCVFLFFWLRAGHRLREETYVGAARTAELRIINVLGCTRGTVHKDRSTESSVYSTTKYCCGERSMLLWEKTA